ncbi:MAG: hypothetical protein FWE41_04595 [Coriobacteriia bacterium]|nr:hypothetical protein [Coriobacteriia bacterium]MCL2750769.1 hypothetical protein [Coriobacteriia bacterium]
MSNDGFQVISLEEMLRDKAMKEKIGEITKGYADEAMEKAGFRPFSNQHFSGGPQSAYVRNKSKDWERIIFSGATNHIWIRLQTKLQGEMKFESYIQGIPCHWRFETLEEFEEICPKMVDAAARFCPRIFDMSANAPKLPPYWADEFTYLFENRESLAADFKKNYGFPDEPFPVDLKRLDFMLFERMHQNYDEVRDLILQAAAYFGESVRERFGGEWAMKDGFDKCIVGFGDIEAIQGNERTSYCSPLNAIAGNWRGAFMAGLSLNQKFLDAGKASGSVNERYLDPYWVPPVITP